MNILRRPKFQMKRAFPLALACTVLVSACQTGELYLSPPLKAKVVDAVTGAPIANVAATMWSTERPDVHQTGRSDESGFVALSAIKGRVRRVMPYGDFLLPPAIVRFEAEGYLPKEVNSDSDHRLFEGADPVKLTPATSGSAD